MSITHVPLPGAAQRAVSGVVRVPHRHLSHALWAGKSGGQLLRSLSASGKGGHQLHPVSRRKEGWSEPHSAAINTAVVQDAATESTTEEESDEEIEATPFNANGAMNLGTALGLPEVDDAEVLKVKHDTEDPTLKLVNCGLSPVTLKALEARGITALFPIQKHVFQPAMAGKDLICRAKTGSGKTLAFAIPVIESLLKEDKESRPMQGRAPRAIVLAPTRELANQVAREFETAASSLKLVCCYGGVPVMGQKRKLHDGVDVVCGTPGRIIDLIQQRAMNLSKIRYVIMDESDSMLDMGFEEDMEQILQHAPKQRQTMLFSATLPQWIKKVARKYLNNHLIVDLVGEEATGKISDTIKAMAIVVEPRSKRQVVGDLLSVHAPSTNSIVFTKTKREADFLSNALTDVIPTEALHGDITQGQREKTLERFRQSKFNVLVATDVAARGLDIRNVDLVVHYDMPDSTEAFLHRSGRTGRAGKSGTTIVMVDRQDMRSFSRIVRESQTKIEMIGPPGPREVMQASAKTVLQRMQVVEPEVVKFFLPAAEKVIQTGNQAQVLAAAFAAMSGFSKVPQHRSLLDNRIGYVTLRCMGKHGRVQDRSVITQLVRDILGPDAASRLEKIEMIDDHKTQMTGALFDLPVNLAITFLQNASQSTSNESRGLQFDRPKCLSMDYVMHDTRGSYGGRGDRRGGRGGGRGSSGGRGSFGGRDRYGDRNASRGGGWGQRGGDSYGNRDNGGQWGSRGGDRYGSGGGGDRYGGGGGRRQSWGERGYSSRSGQRRGYSSGSKYRERDNGWSDNGNSKGDYGRKGDKWSPESGTQKDGSGSAWW